MHEYRIFILHSHYKKLVSVIKDSKDATVVGVKQGTNLYVTAVVEPDHKIEPEHLKRINGDLAILAVISNGTTISNKSLIRLAVVDSKLHVSTTNGIPLEVVVVDDKVKNADFSKEFELKDELTTFIALLESTKKAMKSMADSQEKKSLLLRMALFSQKVVMYTLIPLMVLATLIVMPFRVMLGKKFRIKGKEISLKDTFTFVEGFYNLLLSIESIPEMIVRRRFGIKSKNIKVDITERGRRPDYIINKYITQLVDNSLGIIAGIYIIQNIDLIEYYAKLTVDYIKKLLSGSSGYLYSFISRYPWLAKNLENLWLAINNFYNTTVLFFSYLWINYLVYVFSFIIDFLKEHPISLVTVIIILASSGISGLLNAAADVLTLLILPVKIVYKILQGIHYWVVFIIRKSVKFIKLHSNIILKIPIGVLTAILCVFYAPFFVIYFLLGVIIFFVEIIRSFLRGTARVFDALPIYRSFIWFVNRAPGIPYIQKTENGITYIATKKQRISYVVEDYIDAFKSWWMKNSPKKVVLKFLYVKHPQLATPIRKPEFEELTFREKLQVLKAALGLGTLSESVIKKLAQ